MTDIPEHPVAEAERAIDNLVVDLPAQATVAEQAIALIAGKLPAPVCGALLALESLLGASLNLSVWHFHARGEHDRASEVLAIATRMQEAVTGLLAARRTTGAGASARSGSRRAGSRSARATPRPRS